VDAIELTLMTYGGLVHEKLHGIIDPESMYSKHRPVTLELLEIVSEQKHPDGEFFSLFTKDYKYRRQGVPDLLHIMHRSQFLDMSSTLSAASRGNLGMRRRRIIGIWGDSSTIRF